MTQHRAPLVRRRRNRAVTATLVLALGLLSFGGWQLWERHHATSGTATVAEPNSRGGGELDERRVPLETCKAPDDEPRLISLGSLNVTGCVQKVGKDGQQIEAPGNIHVAGWFTGSAAPGDKGLSIIDGHSSGRYKDGIFNNLGEFEDGSIFTVEYGDGTKRRFEVTSVKTHAVKDTMKRLSADASDEGANLALITCGGNYDQAEHKFDRRVVVLAVNA